jgi:hypothetical protein
MFLSQTAWKQIMNIKKRNSEEQSTTTKPDKGKTLVILTQEEFLLTELSPS